MASPPGEGVSSPLKKMMMIIILLWCYGVGGEGLPPLQGNDNLLLTNIMNALDNLSLQVKEVQSTMVQEMQRLHQCSTQDQMTEFQELPSRIHNCTDGRHECSAKAVCTDYLTRYECSCYYGYSGDGFTCQDVDECRENTDTCNATQLCLNEPGSYTCVDQCPKFFRKERDICQGPVCESPSVFLPELGCLSVFKEQMNWEEALSICQVLGGRLAEGLKRRHRQALYDEFSYLIRVWGSSGFWVGLKHNQWLHAEEEETLVENADWKVGEPSEGVLIECGFIHVENTTSLGLANYHCLEPRYPLCQSLPYLVHNNPLPLI